MLKLIKVLFIYNCLICLVKCNSKNYCSKDFCNNSKQHTLCKYESDDPSSNCLSYERTIFNDVDRERVLDKINNRRNKVAAGEIRSLPPAARMMKLEWNSELELSAQRWADQCVKHGIPDLKDTCRDLDNMRAGQNIATVQGDSPGLTLVALVDVWYMELLKFNSNIISRYVPSFEIGKPHYDYFTQLVWEDTKYVGCGGVKFQEQIGGDRYRTVYRLVCNFAPSGNTRNKTVYSCGAPCSGCSNTVCDQHYKALCEHQPEKDIEYTKKITDIQVKRSPTYANVPQVKDTNTKTVGNTMYDSIGFPMLDKTSEPEVLPFDYIHNLNNPINLKKNDTSSAKDNTGKEDLLKDFIALLKQKLTKDERIIDLLSETAPGHTEVPESSINDDNMAAFVNRIYSTKQMYTSKKTTPKDYVNSTLLVDLIEAVIFRNSDKALFTNSYQPEPETVPVVKPIKIQAELGEVKQNKEFTGHYFFPEEGGETSTESTDSYYDNTDLARSEFEMDIENLKMTSLTKDFLDEIFELEASTESTTIYSTVSPDSINISKSRQDVIKNFLKRIQGSKIE